MNGLEKNWDLNWRYDSSVYCKNVFQCAARCSEARRCEVMPCCAISIHVGLWQWAPRIGVVFFIEGEVSVKIPLEEINGSCDNLRLFSLKPAFSHADAANAKRDLKFVWCRGAEDFESSCPLTPTTFTLSYCIRALIFIHFIGTYIIHNNI